MHKTMIVRLIAAILWLTAAAVSSAAVPLLQKQAQLPLPEFERILAQAGVLTPQGVAIEVAGHQLHGWAQKNGHGQIVGEDPKTFATRLVAAYGSHLPVVELQQRAAAGKFVIPEGTATAPVAAASAPTPTAPAVTPAAGGATAMVERDQVQKWTKAVVDNGDRLAAQAKALASLQGKQERLERQLRAAQAAGTDVAKLREELGTTRTALAEQEKKMAAVAAAATKAAEEAAALAVRPAFTEVGKVREAAKQAVATATAAERAANKVNWLWGSLVGFVLVFGFVLWRIMRQAVNQKQLRDAVTAAEKTFKDETTKQFTALNKGVQKDLAKLEARVEDVAEKAGVNGPDLFNKKVLKDALRELPEGGEYSFDFAVEGVLRELRFTRMPSGRFKVEGICGQVNEVRLEAVVGCIYSAAKHGRIIGAPPVEPADTIPGPLGLRAVS